MKNAPYKTAVESAQTTLVYPKHHSVRGRILGAMLRRERFTSGDALRRFGGSRLAADVDALEQSGWMFAHDNINVKTSDNGRVATVRRYWLTDQSITKAGDRGREYSELTREIELMRRVA